MDDGLTTWFTSDADAFLRRAGEHLAARPVTATVLTTVAERWRASGRPPGSPHDWFCVVSRGGADGVGEVVGVAMRTAPFEPHPIYVLDQPAASVTALAAALVERGEAVAAVNGLRPAVDELADALAAAAGGRVEVDVHHRLFELGTLRPPTRPAGRLRTARTDELALVAQWWRDFDRDADEQAGRPPGHSVEGADTTEDDVRPRVEEGRVWLWVDEDDHPLHLSAAGPAALGVVRIGPVYTPVSTGGAGSRVPPSPRWPLPSRTPATGWCCSPTRPIPPRTPSTRGSGSSPSPTPRS